MTTKDKVTRVAKILKDRFPNLTVQEVIDLAFMIVEAIENET